MGCFNPDRKKIRPDYYDPLGPGRGGGPGMRAGVYKDLRALQPELMARAGEIHDRAASAAGNPGFVEATDLARSNIRGDRLRGSPELDTMVGRMRASGAREGANSAAGIRDQFARNGMTFSTANQQAQQGAQAANTARSGDTEAQMRLGNHVTERANQNNAVGQLEAAQSAPLNYLQMGANPELLPLAQIAAMVQGLSGNGQLVKPDIVENEAVFDKFMRTSSNLTSSL